MDYGRTQLQHPPTRRDHTNRAMIACCQEWQDAERAMNVARCCFDGWLQARHEDTPSTVNRNAYHTHEALHEAARAISLLIETFRVEAAARATTPAGSLNIHRE